MKSVAQTQMLFFLLVLMELHSAKECAVPSEIPDGMNIFCEEDTCFSFCEDDLKSPVNGKDEFNCSEQDAQMPWPFPTQCVKNHCVPPDLSQQSNLIQSCTEMVIIYYDFLRRAQSKAPL